MAFLLITTILALFQQLGSLINEAKWVLVIMDTLILGAAIMIALEAISAFLREYRKTCPGNEAKS
jgi:uncharacterized membrane protein YkgB